MTEIKQKKTLVSTQKIEQLEGLLGQMSYVLDDVKSHNNYPYGRNDNSSKNEKKPKVLGYNIKTLKSMLDREIIEGIFRDYAPLLNSIDPIRVSNNQISKGSINMNLVTGLWFRHSRNIGVGKDIINFIEYAGDVSNNEAICIFAERVKAKNLYKFNTLVRGDSFKGKVTIKDKEPIGQAHPNQPSFIQNSHKKSPWEPHNVVPYDAPKFDPMKDLGFWLKENNWQLTDIYEYRAIDDRLLGYTIKFLEEKTNVLTGEVRQVKQIIPVTYCRHANGRYKRWQPKGFLSEGYKPIYRAECLGYNGYDLKGLHKDPSKPVLIVEGEKTADAASELFPDFCVISWLGGTSSADKVNWNLLKSRQVIIWPDNDEPGKKAASKIENHLIEASGKKLVHLFDIEPLNLPEAWDLADELPDHLTLEQIKNIMNNLLYLPCTVNKGTE